VYIYIYTHIFWGQEIHGGHNYTTIPWILFKPVARSPSPVTNVFKTVKIRGPMTRPVFLAHWVIILGFLLPSSVAQEWNEAFESGVAYCHVLHFLGRAKRPADYQKMLVKHTINKQQPSAMDTARPTITSFSMKISEITPLFTVRKGSWLGF